MNPTHTLSNADYRRLKNLNVAQWLDQELSLFLIWDYINVAKNTDIAKDVPKAFSAHSKFIVEKYKKYLPMFGAIDRRWRFIEKLAVHRSGKKKILFQNVKYVSFMQAARKKYHVAMVVEGKKDRLFAMRHGLEYLVVTELYQYISDYLESNDATFLRKLVEVVKQKLEVLQPDFVVFGLDLLPIDRALIIAAHELSIPTVVIQHGLQDINFPLLDCRACDYILTWGQHFKDLWCQQDIVEPENIYILGYPYAVPKNKKVSSLPQKVLCYLGQDYERYNNDLWNVKLKTLQDLSLLCKKLGLTFLYSPHRGDNREQIAKHFPDMLMTSKSQSLDQLLMQPYVFVSFSSTALLSAAIRSNITLQLRNYPIASENFQMLGVASASCNTIEELQKQIEKILQAKHSYTFRLAHFNNGYIETRYAATQRFLEILKDLELKNASKVKKDFNQ